MALGTQLHHERDSNCRREYAEFLDEQDPLNQIREQFIIPSKQDLKRTVLADYGVSIYKKRIDFQFALLT